MKNVTERIAALSPDKQALLLQRLKQKTSQPQEQGQCQALDRGQPYPLLQRLSENGPLGSDNLLSQRGCVVRYQQNEQAHLRLFCFHYAGGTAALFRAWHDALPPEIELCSIQLPGRPYHPGECAYTRITPLLQALADAISPYLDRPFAFYGHSMGALIGFELARQLRRTHDKHPACLYLAARRAPHIPDPPTTVKITNLPMEVFKVILRADGIPERILQNEDLVQAMLPTLRADFELCDTYEYREEPPLACPFLIFGGQEDTRVSRADLEAWSVHSSATSHLSMLPGSHFFLYSNRDLLLREISQDLEVRLSLLAGEERHV